MSVVSVGHGTLLVVDTSDPAIRQLTDLLEEARLWAWCLQHGKPLALPGEPPPEWLRSWQPPVPVTVDLNAGETVLARLLGERDEARRWARGYEHGYFTVDTDNPPEWLTVPVDD